MSDPRELSVKDIKVGKRARKKVGNVLPLAASIQRVGLLHPVVVNGRRELIAGMRRLAAVKELGWKTVPVRVVESLDDAVLALLAERDENADREPLAPGEMVELGKQIEELEKGEAKKRQAAAGPKDGRGKKPTGSGKLPEPVPGDTRDKVAAALGVSGKTYEKAKKVVENGTPELVDAMNSKAVSIDQAAKLCEMSAEEQRRLLTCDQPRKAIKAALGEGPPPDDDGHQSNGVLASGGSADECRQSVEQMHRELARFQERLSGLMAGEFAAKVKETANSHDFKLWTDGELQGGQAWGSVRYGVAKYTADPLESLFAFMGTLKVVFDRERTRPAAGAERGDDEDPFEAGKELRDDDIEF